MVRTRIPGRKGPPNMWLRPQCFTFQGRLRAIRDVISSEAKARNHGSGGPQTTPNWRRFREKTDTWDPASQDAKPPWRNNTWWLAKPDSCGMISPAKPTGNNDCGLDGPQNSEVVPRYIVYYYPGWRFTEKVLAGFKVLVSALNRRIFGVLESHPKRNFEPSPSWKLRYR